jgi:hypothetical protein
MQINLLHRLECDPYRKEIFKLQQDMVHGLGMRTTILVTASALHDKDILDLIRRHHETYGDEIGLSFHSLDTPDIVEALGYKEIAFWMYSQEDKRKVVRLLIARFAQVFGFFPESAASYHFDASALKILKEECPTINTVVAGCFEEGVRVYHGCNNSWYLFNEGMPWNPWYPSKSHSLRPAKNKDDAVGVVAVPHLSRDMALAYESRNDFWATHPPNVQRGMGNLGEQCLYDKNLIDQHRYQERLNGRYSYLNLFVSAQWLIHNHNSEESPSVSVSLYRQQLEYIKLLVCAGDATVSTLSEFGAWYQKRIPINHRETFLAKEILYGSAKQFFWYINPCMRVLVDLFQGCSIGDLRPYVGEYSCSTGPDQEQTIYGSYPFLIQSQHRTGYLNHCADGARTTAIFEHGEIEVDLAEVEMRCQNMTETHNGFTTEVATLPFGDQISAKLRTTMIFGANGEITIERELLSIEGSDLQELNITEIVKGCWGITEYPESLKSVQLKLYGDTFSEMAFSYKCRQKRTTKTSAAEVIIPEINTLLGLKPLDRCEWEGVIEEGILFNPFYTLKLSRKLKPGDRSKVCLYLKTTK